MRVVLHSPCLDEKDDGDGFQCSMLFPENNQMKVRVTRPLVQQWDSQRSKTPKVKSRHRFRLLERGGSFRGPGLVAGCKN